MDEQVKNLLSQNNELLSLPQTLSEVLRVVRNEDSSAQDLADVLLRDPALTAKILRIVNSPFYGARREIGTVHQAVMTIGTRQVTALALSSSVYNLSHDWDSAIDRVRFWRHCLETAIGSRMIAKKVAYPHVEEAFISGLLHDLGTLILEKSHPDHFAKIREMVRRGESLIDLEEEAWGTNHARVGQFLLEQWNVPDVICTAVGHHHDLFAADTTNPDLKLCQIVCLANMLSQFAVDPEPRRELPGETENREIIKSNLGLTDESVQEIQKQLFAETVREAKFLEMEIGSAEELLEEANKMLFAQYLTVENLLGENRKLRLQITRNKMHEVAQQSLGGFAVELNRYIENATGAMKSRALLIQRAVSGNVGVDPEGKLSDAVQSIVNGVGTIGIVMKDLTNLACLDASLYSDDASVLDLEERIKERLEALNATEHSVAEPVI